MTGTPAEEEIDEDGNPVFDATGMGTAGDPSDLYQQAVQIVLRDRKASTSYIQTAAAPGGRSSAAGLYVACYYAGGSVSGVLPGFFWRFGGWTACVILVLVVQAITIVVAGFGWRE